MVDPNLTMQNIYIEIRNSVKRMHGDYVRSSREHAAIIKSAILGLTIVA